MGEGEPVQRELHTVLLVLGPRTGKCDSLSEALHGATLGPWRDLELGRAVNDGR